MFQSSFNNSNLIFAQKLSLESSPETHQDGLQNFQQNVESTENNGSTEIEIRNISESPHLFGNSDGVSNTTPPLNDCTSVQNDHFDHEATNGTMEIPSCDNFTPEHSRHESSSTMSSQMTHEIINQNNYHQNLPTQQIESSNANLNVANSVSSSLQKEHLLQMADAVANVLFEEHVLDEAALNHSDLEQRNQFLMSCLEEQKRLVNQMYIQVGQYVSLNYDK